MEPYLLQIIESVATLTPKPLERTVKSIMTSLAASIQSKSFVPPNNDNEGGEEEEEEESDQDSAYDYEDHDTRIQIQTTRPVPQTHHTASSSSSPPPPPLPNRTQMFTLLRTHFTQIIQASYKPGFYTISSDFSTAGTDFEFALSVSYPVSLLNVPPRALVAWDRRLLSSSFKNLVVVISGLYKSYPVIDNNGRFIGGIGGGGGNKIKFCVGLCKAYKPSKEGVLHAIRNFTGPSEKRQLDLNSTASSATVDEYDDPDRMRFEKFSLSSSLENVLKEDLIPILQVRLKYGFGWAGAEVVWAKAKGMQIGVDDELCKSCRDVRV